MWFLKAVYEKYRPPEEGAKAKVSEEGTRPRGQTQRSFNFRTEQNKFNDSKKPSADNLKKRWI